MSGFRHRFQSVRFHLSIVIWYYQLFILLFTAIGGVLHELAHKRACDNVGIPVDDVCYFQLDIPCGYVKYRKPRYYGHAIGIALAPLWTNTAVACLAFLGVIGGLDVWGLPPISAAYSKQWVILIGLGWLGVAAAFHAIPSRTDTALAWDETVERLPSVGPLVGWPVVVVVSVLARLSRYGGDYLYTVGLIYGTLKLYNSLIPVRTSVRTLFGL